ncbi:MAG: rRNA adenine N-6-methyltransferase family protein [Acidimicrobiales bacterium]
MVEVGPGPGLTRDLLRLRAARLTTVESHPELAASLKARLDGTNIEVICADATDTNLLGERFTGDGVSHDASSCAND